jgi:WD40 repeat protein
LRCAFGGANDNFVLCGSEDASLTLWNRDKGEVVTKLTAAHSSVINAVAWSPVDPYIFVSCSDDQTIKVWGTESMSPAEVFQDAKDIRRVDTLKAGSGAAGGANAKPYQISGV